MKNCAYIVVCLFLFGCPQKQDDEEYLQLQKLAQAKDKEVRSNSPSTNTYYSDSSTLSSPSSSSSSFSSSSSNVNETPSYSSSFNSQPKGVNQIRIGGESQQEDQVKKNNIEKEDEYGKYIIESSEDIREGITRTKIQNIYNDIRKAGQLKNSNIAAKYVAKDAKIYAYDIQNKKHMEWTKTDYVNYLNNIYQFLGNYAYTIQRMQIDIFDDGNQADVEVIAKDSFQFSDRTVVIHYKLNDKFVFENGKIWLKSTKTTLLND